MVNVNLVLPADIDCNDCDFPRAFLSLPNVGDQLESTKGTKVVVTRIVHGVGFIRLHCEAVKTELLG